VAATEARGGHAGHSGVMDGRITIILGLGPIRSTLIGPVEARRAR
jgi:hypothetical protein